MNKFYVENKDDLRVLIVNTARKKNIWSSHWKGLLGYFYLRLSI